MYPPAAKSSGLCGGDTPFPPAADVIRQKSHSEDMRKESSSEESQQHEQKSKMKGLVTMGAATISDGLVIGLSAGYWRL